MAICMCIHAMPAYGLDAAVPSTTRRSLRLTLRPAVPSPLPRPARRPTVPRAHRDVRRAWRRRPVRTAARPPVSPRSHPVRLGATGRRCRPARRHAARPCGQPPAVSIARSISPGPTPAVSQSTKRTSPPTTSTFDGKSSPWSAVRAAPRRRSTARRRSASSTAPKAPEWRVAPARSSQRSRCAASYRLRPAWRSIAPPACHAPAAVRGPNGHRGRGETFTVTKPLEHERRTERRLEGAGRAGQRGPSSVQEPVHSGFVRDAAAVTGSVIGTIAAVLTEDGLLATVARDRHQLRRERR